MVNHGGDVIRGPRLPHIGNKNGEHVVLFPLKLHSLTRSFSQTVQVLASLLQKAELYGAKGPFIRFE